VRLAPTTVYYLALMARPRLQYFRHRSLPTVVVSLDIYRDHRSSFSAVSSALEVGYVPEKARAECLRLGQLLHLLRCCLSSLLLFLTKKELALCKR
jgi:hypothetical protein